MDRVQHLRLPIVALLRKRYELLSYMLQADLLCGEQSRLHKLQAQVVLGTIHLCNRRAFNRDWHPYLYQDYGAATDVQVLSSLRRR